MLTHEPIHGFGSICICVSICNHCVLLHPGELTPSVEPVSICTQVACERAGTMPLMGWPSWGNTVCLAMLIFEMFQEEMLYGIELQFESNLYHISLSTDYA